VEFEQLDRRSVVQQVAERLRDAVIAAERTAGQLPNETELSSALMVSRPTLREAIRIIEAEGLVQRDHRTAVLRPEVGAAAMSRPLKSALDILTRAERITLAEIADLRVTVEARAAEKAAIYATPGDLETLRSTLDLLRADRITPDEWDEPATIFHIAVVEASHNEAFTLIMLAAREAARDIVKRAGGYFGPEGEERDRAWFETQYSLHEDIYAAIRDGRGEDAGRAVWRWSESFEWFDSAPIDSKLRPGRSQPVPRLK
jgi:GntR family transcriptional regulator, transcriptional repressor for pyruvate dehydrogenase complex